MTNKPQTFGWIPPEDRTLEEERANVAAIAAMPKFAIKGRTNYAEGKVLLFKFWEHPDTVTALGFPFPGVKQITGSCVGAGGGNALATLAMCDAIMRKEPEQIVIPFWPLPYGRSRFYMGDRSPGEGSLGGTFAKAVREDGTLDAKQAGLPEFENKDGLVWGSSTEMKWSDGDAKHTMDLLPESRKHLVKTTAECRNADDVRDAITNGYPVTCASMWGGKMQCPTAGDPPVLLNSRSDQWPHQMSVQAWWDHPSLGEIFWIQNQWGLRAHGKCPSGAPGGGFWIKKSEMDWICRDGEVFAFSGFEGFPARVVPWDFGGGLLV